MIQTIAESQDLASRHMTVAFRTGLSSFECEGFTQLQEGGVLLICGEDHPMSNLALDATLGDVDRCASELLGCGKPSALFFTAREPGPAEDAAQRHGYGLAVTMPAMAAEIGSIPESLCPAGYVFSRLGPDDSPEPWIQAVAEGFGMPASVIELLSHRKIAITGAPDDQYQYFQVTFEGKVVGASMCLLAEGVAGIYCVATLPDHRGKGIGALVTGEPLRMAHSLGYRVGVLQASEMGHPVYRRLGFQDVGTVRMYVAAPGA